MSFLHDIIATLAGLFVLSLTLLLMLATVALVPVLLIVHVVLYPLSSEYRDAYHRSRAGEDV